jgi:hypothetical protein
VNSKPAEFQAVSHKPAGYLRAPSKLAEQLRPFHFQHITDSTAASTISISLSLPTPSQ